MAFQFSTNDLYTYAQTEDVVEPTQTEVSTESDSTATEQPVEPSETVEGAADTTTSPETGTDTTEPAPDTGTTPETQPAEPQQEVAGTLKVEFVDANNATVKESVEHALTSKYVGDTIRLEDLSIETNIEGYTLTEVKDKNDNTQVYTTETKDFVLTGNVTELQFVYTQNVQTDQPEESEDSNAQQGGQEDSNSTQEQVEADEEESDSQLNNKNDETTDNVVKENRKYNIIIHHSLTTNIGVFEEYESITINDSDFVDGEYDLSQHEYKKSGMELSSAPVIDQDDVQTYYAMKYSVKEGYIARRVQKNEISLFARTIYVGTFDDVEIIPAGQMFVNIKAVYENGTIAFSKTMTAVEDDTGKFNFSYDISADIPQGYNVSNESLSDQGYVLSDEGIITKQFESGTESADLKIELIAQDVEYTVKHIYPALTESEDPKIETETLSGKVGQMTEAQPKNNEGFTALDYDQVLITADNKIEVTIEYERNSYTVKYDTQGGSYISPVKGLYEEKVKIYEKQNGEPVPTRQGYTFTGWYKDEACKELADSTINITEDTTVYAGWEAQKVNYTVVLMKEIIDQNDGHSYYAYGGLETKKALVGSTVTATWDENITYYQKGKTTSSTVEADGSTTVYVYYDLIEYTFTFDLNRSNAKLEIGGKTYYDGGTQYSFTAKLGQNIASLWPTQDNIDKVGKYSFYGWTNGQIWGNTTYVTKRLVVTEDMLPTSGETIRATGSWIRSGNTYQVEYWLEGLDGKYYKSDDYSQSYSSDNSRLSPKEIYGYIALDDAPRGYEDSSGRTFRFYYERTTQKIDYYSAGNLIANRSNIKFGSDISSSEYNFIPDKPEELDNECEFAGWYDNSSMQGEPYDFSSMPGNDLILYAKWELPDKNVTLHYNVEGIEDSSVTFKKGAVPKISNPDSSLNPGYEFEGWFINEECTIEYDYNAPLNEDINLYAKWSLKSTTQYTVRYVILDENSPDGYKDISSSITKDGKVGKQVSENAINITDDRIYCGFIYKITNLRCGF